MSTMAVSKHQLTGIHLRQRVGSKKKKCLPQFAIVSRSDNHVSFMTHRVRKETHAYKYR